MSKTSKKRTKKFKNWRFSFLDIIGKFKVKSRIRGYQVIIFEFILSQNQCDFPTLSHNPMHFYVDTYSCHVFDQRTPDWLNIFFGFCTTPKIASPSFRCANIFEKMCSLFGKKKACTKPNFSTKKDLV